MFHPDVVARREHTVMAQVGDDIPGGKLIRRPLDECWAMRDRLDTAVDDQLHPLRELTTAETDFIAHERLLMRLDYGYWSARWAKIVKETAEAAPIAPRWGSQEIFLRHLATIEYDRVTTGHPDGILVNVCKARQLGLSTETEVILAHRVITHTGIRGLVAGDVKEQSQYLFGMAELVIQSLPWWLKPPTKAHRAGEFWENITGATLRTAWGRSARGGLQEREKAKGNIGRGRTYSVVHISELSSWERPEQLDDALLPGIPRRRHVFAVFESTSKGRYDWWHHHWLQADRHEGRFTNIFIPWYIEPDKYWAPAPDGWEPLPTTVQHAIDVEKDSPRFCFGATVRLTKHQLYWYEQTRLAYEGRDELGKFLEEYAATPESSFQYAGRSIFSTSLLEKLRATAHRPVGMFYVQPAKDIALLKQWEREHPAES